MDSKTAGRRREFRLELFGGPRLRRGTTPVRLSPQELTLVVLVAAAGRHGMSRDEILDLLWKSGSHATLRPRLAQILHMVRQKLGWPDAIIDEDRSLLLNEGLFSTDLEEYEEALDAGHFKEALSLLALGFLPNLRGAEAHSLVQWLDDRNVQLRDQARRELSRALQEAQDQADFPRLADLCSLQLDLDPHDEVTLRRLLRAYGAQRRPEEARAELRRFTEMMNNRTPGWRPSQETFDTMESANALSQHTPWVQKYFKSMGPRPNPFHGREGHHALLTGLLNATSSRSPKLLVLSGESGMGRSRTIRQAALDISSSGVSVLLANAGGSGIGQSLHPISQAFAHHELDDIIYTSPTHTQNILLHTILGYPHRHGSATSFSDGTNPIPFSSVCEAVFQLIVSWSQKKPLVLALDDVHLADPDTITLLRYMLRRGLPDRFALIVSVDGKAPNASTIIDLAEPCLHSTETYVLELDPLSSDSLERIGSHILGPTFPGDCLDGIVSLSEGSPKRMVMFSQHIKTQTAASGHCTYPMYRLIKSCYDRLSLLPRDILALLAIADFPLPLDSMAIILSQDRDDVLDTIAKCLTGWVRQAGADFSFIAPICARGIRDNIPDDRQRHLHLSIGRYLVDTEDFGRAHQIAHHLMRGGEADEATTWIEKALALSSQGYDANPALQLAVEAIRSSSDAVKKSRLHLALGHHLLGQGLVIQALEHLEAAHTLILTDDLGSDLLRRVEVALVEAKCLEKERNQKLLLSQINELRDKLLSEKRWGLLARACHVTLRLLDSGEAPEGEAEVLRWLEDLLSREASPPRDELIPLALVFCAQVRKGPSAQAVRVLAETIVHLDQPEHDRLLAEALQLSLLVCYHQGLLNSPQGISLRRRSIAAVSQVQDPTLLCRQYLNTAAWYIDTLDLENAPASLANALQFATSFCPPQLSREVAFNQGELLLLQGRPHEAYDLFLTGHEQSPSASPDAGTILFGTGVAASLVKMKRAQEALPYLPPKDLLFGKWAIDLTMLMTTHSDILTHQHTRVAYIHDCVSVLDPLRETSFLWYVRTLMTISRLQYRHGLPVNTGLLEESRQICENQSLLYLARQLRKLSSSGSR